ncbi:MAG: hypothetical protein CV088_02720 [Nitrospira sp. LK70]|nr:hypothetical protein [Nitrospira sp. LK70]
MSLDLFNLLPAVHRMRDIEIAESASLLTPAEIVELNTLKTLIPPLSIDEQLRLNELTAKASRGPLHSLLLVIQGQMAVLAEDLDQLYDDQFIETCAQWVIPYIGDLIGYQPVKGIAPAIDNPRSEVADTISLRRRKGTVLVMEQLARDVTGWGAHAVEFFQILGDAQSMNHLRLWNHYAPDMRYWKTGLYIETGFDRTAHKVDVRRIASRRGRYNIQNIGISLWSLNAYGVTKDQGAISAVTPQALRFSSLGMDIPLFHRALPQGERIVDPAQPFNVVDRLKRRVLCDDLQKGIGAVYYGEDKSLALYLDEKLLNPYEIEVANLSGPDGSWANMPAAGSPYRAVVDPELGRIALPPAAGGQPLPSVKVFYHYGFNADMGGGEYDRTGTFMVEDLAFVFPFPDTAGVPRYTTLQGAVNFAISQLSANGQAAVEITDSRTYSETGTLALTVDLPAGASLELRAAEGARPTLLLDGEISVSGAASSSFYLNGLLIAGSTAMAPANPTPAALLHAPASRPGGNANALEKLSISHCTLVPGWSVDTQGAPRFGAQPTLIVEPAGLEVIAARSIIGAVRAGRFVSVKAFDTIIDATDPTNVAIADLDGIAGVGSLTLGGLETADPDEIPHGCTVIGKVRAVLLTLVSDSIFWADLVKGDTWVTGLIADRKQEGCVRFSFLPMGAETPRRFECVEQGIASPQPIFFAFRYGRPGYMKLIASTPDVVRRGADDGGEMGAFHFVLAPLRETDLRIRMQEYMPVGLEFGIIYQN